jgi:glycosyltransferase involved in cell wall biosynthesis
MPNTVMEAMASGVPVVCTDAGGVRELFDQGVCGYIVPTRDPAALSERMIHVMSLDEPERLRLGARGRERITSHFDNERVVDRWEDMIRRVSRSQERPASGGPSR